MIKHILSVGDSFTYGEELDNQDLAYPYYIARGLKAEVVNLAKPGSGNTRMVRNIIDHVAADEPVDLVTIGWTSPGRMEFADAIGVYDIWPGRDFNWGNWRSDLQNYINKHHDAEHIYGQYLITIITLQSFLEARGIKYIMMTTNANEYYHQSFYSKSQPRVKLINDTNFIGWPNEGMLEWADGCKKGPNGHFLEDGHRKVAVQILKHINTMGW
jgi:hypothetical protein